MDDAVTRIEITQVANGYIVHAANGAGYQQHLFESFFYQIQDEVYNHTNKKITIDELDTRIKNIMEGMKTNKPMRETFVFTSPEQITTYLTNFYASINVKETKTPSEAQNS